LARSDLLILQMSDNFRLQGLTARQRSCPDAQHDATLSKYVLC
jgi:hypothetical protein